MHRSYMFQCLKCWSTLSNQNRCSLPGNHWLSILSAPFWHLHLLSPFASTWEHLGGVTATSASADVFQLLLRLRCDAWEVAWRFVHSSKVLWSPKVNTTALEGHSPLLLVLLPFQSCYPSFFLELLPCLFSISSSTLKETISKKTVRSSCLFPFCMFGI